jgi:putative tricarboxylic transport membrane protein
MRKKFIVLFLLAAALIILTTVIGYGQEAKYPTKPVTIVYHSQAGSGGDIFCRSLGKAVENTLNQPVLVENRTGGGGANAWIYVADAKPDGYVLLGISSTIIARPLLTPMPVDYTDFKPIAQVFFDPTVIFVQADSKYETFQDIIDDANARPGEQNWGSGSPGSAETLCLRRVAQIADIDINIIPFEGGADVMTNLIGGRLDAAIGEFAEIAAPVEAGQLRIIANLNTERMPDLPDVPTLKEGGVDFVFEKIRGLMAPKDTPDEVIQVWVDVIKNVYDNADFVNYYTNNKIYPLFRPLNEMQKAMDEQRKFFKEMM